MLNATNYTNRIIRIALEKAMTPAERDAYNISRRNAVRTGRI